MNMNSTIVAIIAASVVVGVVQIILIYLKSRLARWTNLTTVEARSEWLRAGLEVALYLVWGTELPDSSSWPQLANAMNLYFHVHRIRITVNEREVEVLFAERQQQQNDTSLAGTLNRIARGQTVRPMRVDANRAATGEGSTAQQ